MKLAYFVIAIFLLAAPAHATTNHDINGATTSVSMTCENSSGTAGFDQYVQGATTNSAYTYTLPNSGCSDGSIVDIQFTQNTNGTATLDVLAGTGTNISASVYILGNNGSPNCPAGATDLASCTPFGLTPTVPAGTDSSVFLRFKYNAKTSTPHWNLSDYQTEPQYYQQTNYALTAPNVEVQGTVQTGTFSSTSTVAVNFPTDYGLPSPNCYVCIEYVDGSHNITNAPNGWANGFTKHFPTGSPTNTVACEDFAVDSGPVGSSGNFTLGASSSGVWVSFCQNDGVWTGWGTFSAAQDTSGTTYTTASQVVPCNGQLNGFFASTSDTAVFSAPNIKLGSIIGQKNGHGALAITFAQTTAFRANCPNTGANSITVSPSSTGMAATGITAPSIR